MSLSIFLNNCRAPNYIQLVDRLLTGYGTMKCNMSLKICFLHSHLDFFPKILGAISDKHGKRFQQDIATMKSAIRPIGIHQCWLTDVGDCSKMHQTLSTNENQ
uniref:Uncharacterized protein n=1 Tax=Micrurus corallinus TaxID=54390 RepID=A0A2D4G9F0_MICCO